MVGQFLDNVLSNCLIIGQCCVQQLDSVVSNSPMVGLCCVQLSKVLLSDCSTVQWSDCAFSNCLMVGQFLCPTSQKLESAVSNCLMVGQCCVQQYTG